MYYYGRQGFPYLRSFAFICGLLSVTGCARQPAAYAPPTQIVMPSGPEPIVALASDPLLIVMSDPDANSRIVAGVFPGDPGDEWRQAGLHPKFRLHLERIPQPLRFYMRFDTPAESSFTIIINGNRFQSPRSSSGAQEYRRTLPDGWISGPGPVDISLDMEQSVRIHSIGFEER